MAQYKEQIIEKVKDNGFNIAMTKIVQLDKKTAEEFYSEHKDKKYFDDLVTEMTS